MEHKKWLLISRIGPDSTHETWLDDTDSRLFDVFLSSYCEPSNVNSEMGIFYEYRAGTKVAGYAELFAENHELMKKYEYIALFDDDVIASTSTINDLFSICSQYNIKIAQPALTFDSYFTYAGLVEQPAFTLRYVTFIEMMCPVFRVDVLETIKPLFSMGFESGIDLVWCNAVYRKPIDFAVIDKTPVFHSKPVGIKKHENGFIGREYEDDINAVLKEYSLPWLPCLPYFAVDKNGIEVNNRIYLILHSIIILKASLKKKPSLPRLRSIITHFYHIIFKKAKNKNIYL